VDVTCYYEYPGLVGPPILIGTDTGLKVNTTENVNATFSWDTSSLTATGIYYTILTNATEVQYEYDTTGNTASTGIRVLGHGTKILVTYAPDSVTVGETVLINATVAAVDYNQTSIDVTCYYQYSGGLPTLIGTDTVNVNATDPPENVNATFSWDTSSLTVTGVVYSIWANSSIVAYEYNTADNTGQSENVYVNPAEVPEFPLGAAMEIALVAVVIYLWWRSRRLTKPSKTRLNYSLQALKRG